VGVQALLGKQTQESGRLTKAPAENPVVVIGWVQCLRDHAVSATTVCSASNPCIIPLQCHKQRISLVFRTAPRHMRTQAYDG
jgi:hypothetical protein